MRQNGLIKEFLQVILHHWDNTFIFNIHLTFQDSLSRWYFHRLEILTKSCLQGHDINEMVFPKTLSQKSWKYNVGVYCQNAIRVGQRHQRASLPVSRIYITCGLTGTTDNKAQPVIDLYTFGSKVPLPTANAGRDSDILSSSLTRGLFDGQSVCNP